MARRTIAAILVMLATVAGADAVEGGPDPSGVWLRGDGNARVRIAPCGAKICATNLWIKDSSGGEEVGDRLVMTVKPKNASTLSGKAFDVKRNMTYAIDITVKRSSLTTRGCIVGGLVCKAVNWSRAK
ncbi:MAG: DUF2147 domain-containing protein [Rhizobiaceae bacterium]|nr:DUF2147 domain-containing protein [Rhizobiaceae bacterium]